MAGSRSVKAGADVEGCTEPDDWRSNGGPGQPDTAPLMVQGGHEKKGGEMTKTNLEITKIINELEEILTDEMRNVESKISHSAPQSFCDDMKGCSRGIYIAKNTAIKFLKKKLLG